MDPAESPNSKRRKSIEATVIDVLKSADFETATELSIRAATAHRLGLDRFDLDQKRLIRTVLESFLLSSTTTGTTNEAASTIAINGVHQIEAAATESTKTGISNEVQQVEAEGQTDVVLGLEAPLEGNDIGGPHSNGHNNDNSNSGIICQLSSTRNVIVRDFKGQSTVTIQDFYQKDGKQFPKSGGMSLTAEQWLSIKNNIPAVEEVITRMKSRLRLRTAGNPSEPAVSCLVVDSAQVNATVNNERMEASIYNSNSTADLQESNFEGSKQMEVNCNASTIPNPLHHSPLNSVQVPLDNHIPQPSGSASRGNLHHDSSISLPLPGLMYMPVRLDGTNYYLWKHQMEFFLAELKVGYVLTEACPSFSHTSSGTREEIDQAKASIQKWVDDDYICRHNILACLSDSLYNDYSRKVSSAKELWEELKSVYDEDIGTKRSQINKYVQFQIVDGVSILEQVHELQSIAHSICASGIWIDEYFHVCVIISKLPTSWKEFRLRMMREDFLPLHMLMHRLKVEEDARNGKQPGKPTGHGVGSKCEARVGSHGREIKKLCYNCKKLGHISKNCPDRKTEVCDNGTTKENGHCLKGDRGYQG